jgi:hypothetical protein
MAMVPLKNLGASDAGYRMIPQKLHVRVTSEGCDGVVWTYANRTDEAEFIEYNVTARMASSPVFAKVLLAQVKQTG